MTKLKVDFLNLVKAPNKREEQRTDRQTVQRSHRGADVLINRQDYVMKLLASRAGLQPRQNGASNRFLSSPKCLNRVFGPPSPHSVVIMGSFFFWGKKNMQRKPNDLAAPSSESKKELRISHYSD
jgi:hypothetical protein